MGWNQTDDCNNAIKHEHDDTNNENNDEVDCHCSDDDEEEEEEDGDKQNHIITKGLKSDNCDIMTANQQQMIAISVTA